MQPETPPCDPGGYNAGLPAFGFGPILKVPTFRVGFGGISDPRICVTHPNAPQLRLQKIMSEGWLGCSPALITSVRNHPTLHQRDINVTSLQLSRHAGSSQLAFRLKAREGYPKQRS